MVFYRRNYVPGGTYFFTLTLRNRSSRLLTDNIDSLRQAFNTVKIQHPFIMKAFVVLPEHLHVIWQLPDDDMDYPVRWKKIKTLFSKQVQTNHNESGIWQKRFWEHTIRDERDYENHVNYIHYNPIKHGYVHELKDWPYSSFHHYVQIGHLPANWGYTEEPIIEGYTYD